MGISGRNGAADAGAGTGDDGDVGGEKGHHGVSSDLISQP
jgi:hypothetical protein